MAHFPDKMPKGRIPSRDYFFNVMNTLQAPYLQSLIIHANDQRNSAEAEGMEKETMVVSDKMWHQLNAAPFVSSKLILFLTIFIGKKGKTVYLLKESAKPVADSKKRRKIQLASLPPNAMQNPFGQQQARAEVACGHTGTHKPR